MLGLLPPYEGKSVLELGAGIGRFTGELAKKAGQLIALDFIESAIKKVYDTSRIPFFLCTFSLFIFLRCFARAVGLIK